MFSNEILENELHKSIFSHEYTIELVPKRDLSLQ